MHTVRCVVVAQDCEIAKVLIDRSVASYTAVGQRHPVFIKANFV